MPPLKSISGGHFTHPSKGVMPNVSPRTIRKEYHGRIQVRDTLLPGRFNTNSVHEESLAAARQALGGTIFLEDMFKATREEDMYAHLERYITAVVSAVHAHRKTEQRHTQSAKFGCDAPLMDVWRPEFSTFARKDLPDHFRYTLALWELKTRSEIGPSPDEAQKPNAVMAQVADTVRLRVGSRPCQPFTLTIILCGGFFWGSAWDQAGVVVSNQNTVKEEEDLFLRLIISVRCNMDAYHNRQNSRTRFFRNFDFVPPASHGGANGPLNTAYALSTISNVRGDNLCGEAFRASPSNTELLGLRHARVAKAIYQYDTDLELLRGARDILKGLMAMNRVGWMHRDVSASNCLLSCDPADGPSLVLDMEFAKKVDRQAPASKTAISGTAQFMARELLKSMLNQKASAFGHLQQHDLESLVYVLAYAVMKKESSTMSVKDKDGTKLAEMTDLYHEAFGHNTIYAIRHARSDFYETWTKYRSVVAGDAKPSVLHKILGALVLQVNKQYTLQETEEYDEDDIPARPAVPMDGKRMRRILKQGIAVEKASLKDDSADSDVDANYD